MGSFCIFSPTSGIGIRYSTRQTVDWLLPAWNGLSMPWFEPRSQLFLAISRQIRYLDGDTIDGGVLELLATSGVVQGDNVSQFLFRSKNFLEEGFI